MSIPEGLGLFGVTGLISIESKSETPTDAPPVRKMWLGLDG